MPETRISDYAAFLRDLGASKADYFLGGGQAVNFWAEFYSGMDAEADLISFLPFTSKDFDIWVSYDAFQYIRTNTGIGKLVVGTSLAGRTPFTSSRRRLFFLSSSKIQNQQSSFINTSLTLSLTGQPVSPYTLAP